VNKIRANQCHYRHPNQSRCRTYAVHGSKFCYFHDEQCRAKRDAARQAGGRARSRKITVLSPTTADQPLDTAGDVLAMLAATANQVRRGEIDPKIANNVGYLCCVALMAMKQAHLENVRRLEEIVAAQDVSIDPENVEFVSPQKEEDDEDYDDDGDDEGEEDEDGEDDEDEEDEDDGDDEDDEDDEDLQDHEEVEDAESEGDGAGLDAEESVESDSDDAHSAPGGKQ
jgi:hypothetical protein